MTTTTRRKPLHAYVGAVAHDGWHDFAGSHGVSASALMAAIGEALAADQGQTPGRLDLAAAVARARMIDVENRRRTR